MQAASGGSAFLMLRSISCVKRVAFRWPAEWTCAAPPEPFTVAETHVAMQWHREHGCARKRAAWGVLVAAGWALCGHIRPPVEASADRAWNGWSRWPHQVVSHASGVLGGAVDG